MESKPGNKPPCGKSSTIHTPSEMAPTLDLIPEHPPASHDDGDESSDDEQHHGQNQVPNQHLQTRKQQARRPPQNLLMLHKPVPHHPNTHHQHCRLFHRHLWPPSTSTVGYSTATCSSSSTSTFHRGAIELRNL